MQISIPSREKFEDRHIGPSEEQIADMLKAIDANSLDDLINQTVPASIRMHKDLNLPLAEDEYAFLNNFKKLAAKNHVFKSYIGAGYYDCIVPKVILRNILENPGWYTAYTPYQAEIAQGRLEALINFQTLVTDLTGMEIANASLLDEGTAAAEAMAMFYNSRKGTKKSANTFLVDSNLFPQSKSVIQGRANPIGINVEYFDATNFELSEDAFALIVQYPNDHGEVIDYSNLVEKAKEANVHVIFAVDLMSLVLLKSPGAIGADCVVGSSQRFGVPMGYGGPHAAFLATHEDYKRKIPGRIIGASVDSKGKNAYRMALQTREQHIRRDKATSNICTAQVLLSVMAGMYAVYHGPEGLKNIAKRIHGFALLLDKGLKSLGFEQTNKYFFDTIRISFQDPQKLRTLAEKRRINLRYFEDAVCISLDETKSYTDITELLELFAEYKGDGASVKDFDNSDENLDNQWPSSIERESDFLTHPVFNTYHSEHEMLRYLKHLENKDLSLTHSMISLGSCTMKLNATTEMIPVTWEEWGRIHPFAPKSQTQGYQIMFEILESWLAEITGFHRVSLQPNSGAQGEFAGLMVIRAYHEDHDQGHRNITLIPSSAHGTNPASAVMAGQKVVVVACDENGNINVDDLRAKAKEHEENLAALMVTYPSTHGVFEESIQEICNIIHGYGGLVYMDGANLNAQLGLTSPGLIGADVCHLNLHKTFCIPHGGGGPGMGPIGVVERLAPYLPGNPVIETGGSVPIDAISAAPWGSASILPISYAYIAMMGPDGLKRATQVAILVANYAKERLNGYYDVLYTGKNGRNAHELIIDCRGFKKVGIEVVDIAKRLMDYGFHAPTVSFPVAGTMMIEPTESETKDEIDRFCDALIEIRKEIEEIEKGKYPEGNNVLNNAPHTMEVSLNDNWDYPYSREKAVYPLAYVKEKKFWPSVSRINDAYGDRNLVCTCLPIEAYA